MKFSKILLFMIAVSLLITATAFPISAESQDTASDESSCTCNSDGATVDNPKTADASPMFFLALPMLFVVMIGSTKNASY